MQTSLLMETLSLNKTGIKNIEKSAMNNLKLRMLKSHVYQAA